jgi:hypothetical protein
VGRQQISSGWRGGRRAGLKRRWDGVVKMRSEKEGHDKEVGGRVQ